MKSVNILNKSVKRTQMTDFACFLCDSVYLFTAKYLSLCRCFKSKTYDMNKCSYIALIILILASILPLRGQDLSFQQFGRAEGLSDGAVTSISEDSLGFLWVGTRLGLNRLEGEHFRSYYYSEGGLTGNIINALQKGSDSRLWIGTNKGLCVYDVLSDSITPVTSEDVNLGQEVSSLGMDANGGLWIRLPDGFCRLNLQNGSVHYFEGRNYFYPTRFLSTRDGKLWMAAWDGTLRRYNPAHNTFDTFRILSDEDVHNQNYINDITETASGQIIVATRNKGLRLFSPLTGEVKTLFTSDARGKPIYIHRILCDSHGRVWIGTETGVHVWNETQGLHIHQQKDMIRNDALSDNAIHSFYEDAAGGFWIGTYFAGVCHLTDRKSRFHIRQVTEPSGMPVGKVIREIIPGADGQLWVTTEDCGLCVLSDANAPLRPVTLTWQGKTITRNVQTVMADGNRLWLGTFDEGIYCLDTSTQQITTHYTNSDGSGLCNLAIVHIIKTRQGEILVGTWDGLCRFDSKEKRFCLVKGLEQGFVHDIFQRHNGEVWVASLNRGLFRIIGEGNSMRAENIIIGLKELTSLAEDSEENLLVGTHDGGYHVYDPVKDTLSATRLPNMGICHFIKDAMGRIWVTTTRGLFCDIPTDGSYATFSNSDGLSTKQFSRNSGYIDSSGTIYVGTTSGLVSFDPMQIGQSDIKPEPRFIMLLPDRQSLLFTDKITLQHDASFSVEYAATCHSTSEPLWFRYRLEGTNAGWTVTQSITPIRFYSLPPGHYTLRLQATNEYGNWPDQECRLDIHVLQPWWWTWTARIIYVSLLAAIAGLINIIHSRRSREKQKFAKEQADAARYREVLQSKINFFTAITHEIRTPLTLITGSLQRLRSQGITENVDIMQRNTDRLLALVNQLMDFRKIESSAFLMNFEDVDIETLIRKLFEDFKPLARQRDIEYSFADTKSPTVNSSTVNYHVLADREAITKIISNLLSNALKFCDKHVNIKISCTENQVRIAVSNDGPRIPTEQVQEIFKPFHQYFGTSARATVNGSGLGLSLARSLAEMHNGTLTYDTEDTTQNTFVLTLQKNTTALHQDESGRLDSAEVRRLEQTVRTLNQDERNVGEHPTVLLVDDEGDLRRFVAEELTDKYNILEANNGEEALNMLREKDIALIVTDLMMPVMDGTALCQAIRADIALCHIPIIVLTAKVSLQDHIDVLNCGADAYIEKPFSTAQLIAQIANLLHSRELLRQTFVRSPYALPDTITHGSIDQKFLSQLNDYIDKHLADTELSVESLASKMNMSVSTFYRKVKAVTSLSPLDYIRLSRLKRGATMLAGGHMRVKEVADSLGFSSTTYFATCFMRQFGMTPTDFIKASKKEQSK